MNEDTTVTINADSVRAKAKAALESVDNLNVLKAKFKAEVDALNALPKTPTGRTKRFVAEAIEGIEAQREHAYGLTEKALVSLRAALSAEVRKAIAECASEEATFKALSGCGFKRIDASIRQDLIDSTKRIEKHNETATRKDAVYCVYISADDRIYVNEQSNVLLILQEFSHTGGYLLRFAGQYNLKSRDGIGLYIPDSGRDISSMFNSMESGTVNLSAIGSEGEDACIARLNRIICVVNAIKTLRVQAPCISSRSNFLEGITGIQHYSPEQADSKDTYDVFMTRRYKDLVALASGKALNVCLITYAGSSSEPRRVVVDLAVDNGIVEDEVLAGFCGEETEKRVFTPVHNVVPEIL